MSSRRSIPGCRCATWTTASSCRAGRTSSPAAPLPRAVTHPGVSDVGVTTGQVAALRGSGPEPRPSGQLRAQTPVSVRAASLSEATVSASGSTELPRRSGAAVFGWLLLAAVLFGGVGTLVYVAVGERGQRAASKAEDVAAKAITSPDLTKGSDEANGSDHGATTPKPEVNPAAPGEAGSGGEWGPGCDHRIGQRCLEAAGQDSDQAPDQGDAPEEAGRDRRGEGSEGADQAGQGAREERRLGAGAWRLPEAREVQGVSGPGRLHAGVGGVRRERHRRCGAAVDAGCEPARSAEDRREVPLRRRAVPPGRVQAREGHLRRPLQDAERRPEGDRAAQDRRVQQAAQAPRRRRHLWASRARGRRRPAATQTIEPASQSASMSTLDSIWFARRSRSDSVFTTCTSKHRRGVRVVADQRAERVVRQAKQERRGHRGHARASAARARRATSRRRTRRLPAWRTSAGRDARRPGPTGPGTAHRRGCPRRRSPRRGCSSRSRRRAPAPASCSGSRWTSSGCFSSRVGVGTSQ